MLGRGGTDQEANLNLRDDALGQRGAAVGIRSDLDGRASIEGRVAQGVGVAEQGFDAKHVIGAPIKDG